MEGSGCESGEEVGGFGDEMRLKDAIIIGPIR